MYILFMVCAGIDRNSMPVVKLEDDNYDYAGCDTGIKPAKLTFAEVGKAMDCLESTYGRGVIRFEIYPVREEMTGEQLGYHERMLK